MKSASKSTSPSDSEVYQDVHGCCSNQEVCSACSKSALHTDNAADDKNCYEVTVKYLLSQLARGDTEVLKSYAEDEGEQEPLSHYYHGGYHVLRLGEFMNQRKYFIIRKLGWDELSTQWLARDTEKKRYVSVNIYKSSEMHTSYARNLINVYTKLQEKPSDRLMKILDHFEVSGTNGTHMCLVTEIMAECLCNYMIRQKFQPVPLAGVKRIVQQLIEGLHHLHVNNELVHTSIKPESVFFKGDRVYIMTLVYEAYMGFYKSTIPNSFVCNLPDRLAHFRTNITDVYPHIQTKMLLLDQELEQFVNREESLRMSREMKPMYDLQKWLTDEGKGHKSHEQPSFNKVPDSTNTLMKRLSRYIKSKINLQQSTTQNLKKVMVKKKSNSFSMSESSNESKYKSSHTTNYRSPSSTSSSKSTTSQISSTDLSDFENREAKSDEETNTNELKQIQDHVKTCCIATENPHTIFSRVIEEDNEEDLQSNKLNCENSDLEEERVFGTNGPINNSEIVTTTENISQSNNGNICFEYSDNLNVHCNAAEKATVCFIDDTPIDSLGGSFDRIVLKTVVSMIEDEHQLTNTNRTEEKDEKLKSDSWDDIKISPDHSDNETSVSCKSRRESKVQDTCHCYHCQNVGHSSHDQDETTSQASQGDSSYSTSTSTQESYSEFLLSYCKHNTLCTTYTRYLKQISQNVAMNLDFMSPNQNFQIVIADLEHARPENDETIRTEDIHRQYKAIELIYTKQFDAKIDIWSTACLTFELVTGDYLFNPFESKYYTIDEHHILKIIQLMAEIPPNLFENERCIRNIKALLERDQQNITSMTAKENFYRILARSYKLPKEDAKQLVRFLIPMLRMSASERVSAAECLQSEWFST